MNKSETQSTEGSGTRITSIDDFIPGVLYRLNIHEYIQGVATPIARQEYFYIPESESGVVSHDGLAPVIRVGENGEEEKTQSFYGLSDLGIVIERSAKRKSPPSSNTMA